MARIFTHAQGESAAATEAKHETPVFGNWEDVEDDAQIWEREGRANLELIRQDPDAHLGAPVAKRLVFDTACEPEDRSVILRHLRRCAWCRGILADTLELGRVARPHTAYELLDKAEEWARMAAAGIDATEDARRSLLEKGVGYVFEHEGVLYEHRPDGTTQPYCSETDATSDGG